MVEAAPPAAFIIAEAKFLLELLIIALDPPPRLCQIDQTIEGGALPCADAAPSPVVRSRREP